MRPTALQRLSDTHQQSIRNDTVLVESKKTASQRFKCIDDNHTNYMANPTMTANAQPTNSHRAVNVTNVIVYVLTISQMTQLSWNNTTSSCCHTNLKANENTSTYIRIYVHLYMHMSVCTYIYSAHICTYVHLYTYVCEHSYIIHIYIYIIHSQYTYIIYIYVYMYICICSSAYMYI